MKVQCSRCGKEITETYPVQYTSIRGVYYRDYPAYGKLRFWHPEQSKGDVPKTVVLCGNCYEDFVVFLEEVR